MFAYWSVTQPVLHPMRKIMAMEGISWRRTLPFRYCFPVCFSRLYRAQMPKIMKSAAMNHGYSTYSGASSAGMPGMTTFVMTPTLLNW